ncbi:F0F1 ATP synthase subunit epsilon [Tepidibacillus marianensis]|uniref:F0F1 ATP synthase subunit epsilon n=1 Tax=Tepidibacillus marianensis TaxID=3131995 RepID=UPI0030CEEFEA
MSTIQLEIVTPERKVYSNEVNMIIARGVEGELGILPKHAPFVTPLVVSALRIKRGNQEDVIAVSGGFLEVSQDKVVILAESAELPEEIDIDRAMESKERAERRLVKAGSDELDFKRAQLSLQRAMNRLDVAKRK